MFVVKYKFYATNACISLRPIAQSDKGVVEFPHSPPFQVVEEPMVVAVNK